MTESTKATGSTTMDIRLWRIACVLACARILNNTLLPMCAIGAQLPLST